MDRYEITVNVGTYNPDWQKLKATLNSVMLQKDVHVQIVVSDDGSKNNFFPEIRAHFEACDFHDYRLVANETNQGIVAQICHGISFAEGTYVKIISPGDLLYDEHTLHDWLQEVIRQNADISFCNAVFYHRKDGHIHILKHRHNPNDIGIYQHPSSYHHRVFHYLVQKQWIAGATVMAKRDLLIYYMDILKRNQILYFEDFYLRLAVLDDRRITYYPHIGLWYEFADGGISTSDDGKWIARMKTDDARLWRLCEAYYQGQDRKVRNWVHYCVRYYDLYENKKKKRKRREMRMAQFFKNPIWFWWKMQMKKINAPIEANTAFFASCQKACVSAGNKEMTR